MSDWSVQTGGILETIHRERLGNNSRGNLAVCVIWRYLVAFEYPQIPQDSFRSLLFLVCDRCFARVAEQNLDKESARYWCWPLSGYFPSKNSNLIPYCLAFE